MTGFDEGGVGLECWKECAQEEVCYKDTPYAFRDSRSMRSPPREVLEATPHSGTAVNKKCLTLLVLPRVQAGLEQLGESSDVGGHIGGRRPDEWERMRRREEVSTVCRWLLFGATHLHALNCSSSVQTGIRYPRRRFSLVII
jgi:hypothetical protein